MTGNDLCSANLKGTSHFSSSRVKRGSRLPSNTNQGQISCHGFWFETSRARRFLDQMMEEKHYVSWLPFVAESTKPTNCPSTETPLRTWKRIWKIKELKSMAADIITLQEAALGSSWCVKGPTFKCQTCIYIIYIYIFTYIYIYWFL